jgi:transcriptional regulator with XRE-family HTH domain
MEGAMSGEEVRGDGLRMELSMEAPGRGEMHVERRMGLDGDAAQRLIWEVGSLAALFLAEGQQTGGMVRAPARMVMQGDIHAGALLPEPATRGTQVEAPKGTKREEPPRLKRARSIREHKISDKGKRAFAEWLVGARTERGWKRIEVAVRLQVGEGTVATWEKGQYAPHGGSLQKVAQIFETPLERLLELLEGDGRSPKISAVGKRGQAKDGAVGEEAVFFEVVKEPVVDRVPCDGCKVRARCKADELVGLPVWCERITKGDVATAEIKGLGERLAARYESAAVVPQGR